ncbi:MAG: cell division protein ZapB [Treponema sp.]
MLNLDQIKQLETKVAKAIQLIQSLKEENDSLKLELNTRQQRIDELENIVLVFKNDQAKIEEGIINALNHLSAFEDTVYQAASTAAVVSGEQHQPVHTPDETVEAPECTCGAQDIRAEETGDEQAADTPAAASETEQNSEQMEIF